MTEQNTSSNRGWTIVFAALGINLVLGVLYAWGVIKAALRTQWGWTDTQAAMPFSVSTAAFAITMVFAGRAQDKIGPRLVVMLGGLMLGLGLIASSFTQSPVVILITFGVIGGIGIGLGYSSTTPPAIKWFPPAKKGLITGIVVSGVGLAAVWISPLTQALLANTSISRTFLILGIGTIVIVSVLAQFLTNPPAGYTPASTAPAGSAPAKAAALLRRNLDWNEMLATRQFYLLWTMFVLTASAGLMIIAHVPTIANEQAHWKLGFVPVAMLAIFNTCGRISSGYLSDRIGRTQTMVIAFLLQAVNMFFFAKYTTVPLLVFGAAFTGLCYGTIFTLMPAATADFYGMRNLGVNYGILFTGFGIAGVLGPILAGMIHDRTGNYQASYLACAIMLVVGAVLAFIIRAPKASIEAPVPAAA